MFYVTVVRAVLWIVEGCISRLQRRNQCPKELLEEFNKLRDEAERVLRNRA